MTVTWAVAALDAATFPQLHYLGGNALAFLPYLCGATLLFLFAYNCMPETKSMTFANIQVRQSCACQWLQHRLFERDALLRASCRLTMRQRRNPTVQYGSVANAADEQRTTEPPHGRNHKWAFGEDFVDTQNRVAK